MQRRQFLSLSARAALASTTAQWTSRLYAETKTASPTLPKFPSTDPKYRRAWDSCIQTLLGNIHLHSETYDKQVLIEGAQYGGVWMECAPQEGLIYASLAKYIPEVEGKARPIDIARANHTAFFARQREDGQLPAYIWEKKIGFSQIQMVVPIAATAWELSQQMHDEEFLQTAYTACSKWDAWLLKYRNTRGTGLTEGFCTYDTGHDNSPRWKGMPNACPKREAKNLPAVPSLPRLCPDLSATTYGARVALASMAKALGKKSEADRWLHDAEHIRRLIIKKLYSPEDACFFDLDAQNKFVKVRGDALTRVLGEHVLKLNIASDRRIFNDIWKRQIHNPDAFWTPYPLPSIAIDDPTFVRPIPRNSWGGASQPLTALRTLRWMDHYGKHADFEHMMHQWVEAITQSEDIFQQIDPVSGEWTRPDQKNYSPTALVYMAYVDRLQHVKHRS